ncbi:DsbE family thiol:disulfide interchange protein [Pseudothauera nasutitermitis]|uniref:DsbE family thiol:disulfide interchange protein n=1 Tax=Pseudothauera nasutitermitis TaxID=2565930 RepID=A0A4S4AND1_9RHOO|nr:DsbE family thiol:disulfide interchange protein [Pseudothauera nasutitermitis]THF61118.1 DsbE family thiol:disulfide interchange protein [Pseudothauera nasutitermitis]
MKAKFLVPLFLFLLLVGFLAYGLRLNPREVPSALIDKPAPAFRLAQLHQPDSQFGTDDLRGQVWLLNVWASWCVGCHQEHPYLMELARSAPVPLIGLNYKDERADAIQFLNSKGDPYQHIGVDADGKVGFEYGVYGAPETFLIDREGVIRYKHIGPLTREIYERELKPRIEELSRVG